MRRGTRYAALGALLLTITFTASACGPETADGLTQFAFGLWGAGVVVVVAIAVLLGSIPPN